jgi:hypothetical protein
VFVLIIQARVLWQQNEIMKSQSKIMAGQRLAAEQQGLTLKDHADTLKAQHAAIQEQAGYMAEGLRLTRDGLVETRKAAGAAEKNARAARDTMYISQRARVSIFQVTLENFGAEKSPFGVVQLVNRGNKPAQILESAMALSIGSEPWPEQPEYGELRRPANVPLDSADRPLTQRIDFATTIPSGHWTEIQRGTLKVRLCGFVSYNDGFHKIRKTCFGVEYDPEASQAAGKPIFGFTSLPGYNYQE